ncbi:MAG: Gfo/Idh/MocA family oxidoreductase [Candidatus Hydrogenedentes bacterium]|nr:Gfo/Idh/MocA family oxidoreductase [Candidatus Hydrogenedentota bacterium]
MKTLSRRAFLKRTTAAGAAFAAPQIVPSSVLGLGETTAPSERIVMAGIGTGGMGTLDIVNFTAHSDVQFIALCDAGDFRMAKAKAHIDEHYGNTDCKLYGDWREVIARDDIDAVMIATPDHWHALISIEAAKAGKDIYCEKPISLTVAEGRLVVEAMKKYKTVYQSGTQRRSIGCFQFAVQAARNKVIGELHTIHTNLSIGQDCGPQKEEPVPAGFNYDMWLGPAPLAPYTPKRCFGSFRWIYDYSGGQLTDIGAHFNDLAQWGNDSEHTGPLDYEGWAVWPRPGGLFNTPVYHGITATYASGVRLIMHDHDPRAVRFEGAEGWVCVDDFGNVTADPKSILETGTIVQEDYAHWNPHHRNFLDCVKSREQTIAPPEIAHRSSTICHIGNICLRLGRPVRWNPEREQFENDDEANRMLAREMRAPWSITV